MQYRVADYETYIDCYPGSNEVRRVFTSGMIVRFDEEMKIDNKQLHKLVEEPSEKDLNAGDGFSVGAGNAAGNAPPPPNDKGNQDADKPAGNTPSDAKAAARAKLAGMS